MSSDGNKIVTDRIFYDFNFQQKRCHCQRCSTTSELLAIIKYINYFLTFRFISFLYITKSDFFNYLYFQTCSL